MTAFIDNSAEAQCLRLADALRCGPVTKEQAVVNFGITTIHQRIHDLRHNYGLPVVTVQKWIPTENGKVRCESCYSLAPFSKAE